MWILSDEHYGDDPGDYAEPGPGGPRLADLEFQDEPDAEDLAELDRRTWAHIAALIAQHEGDDPEDDDEDDDQAGPGELGGPEDDDQAGPGQLEGDGAPDAGGTAATPGPLAGPLGRLIFRLEAGPASGPGPRGSRGRRVDPSDYPGAKGGA